MGKTVDEILAEARAKASGLLIVSPDKQNFSNSTEENMRERLKLAQERALRAEAELTMAQEEKEKALKLSDIYEKALADIVKSADDEQKKLQEKIDELTKEGEEREKEFKEKANDNEKCIAENESLRNELQLLKESSEKAQIKNSKELEIKDKAIEILTTQVTELKRITVEAQHHFKEMQENIHKMFGTGNKLFESITPSEPRPNGSTNSHEIETAPVNGNYNLRIRGNIPRSRRINRTLGDFPRPYPRRKRRVRKHPRKPVGNINQSEANRSTVDQSEHYITARLTCFCSKQFPNNRGLQDHVRYFKKKYNTNVPERERFVDTNGNVEDLPVTGNSQEDADDRMNSEEDNISINGIFPEDNADNNMDLEDSSPTNEIPQEDTGDGLNSDDDNPINGNSQEDADADDMMTSDDDTNVDESFDVSRTVEFKPLPRLDENTSIFRFVPPPTPTAQHGQFNRPQPDNENLCDE